MRQSWPTLIDVERCPPEGSPRRAYHHIGSGAGVHLHCRMTTKTVATGGIRQDVFQVPVVSRADAPHSHRRNPPENVL
eukprot:15397901-Alexandrium_andersonii.AAC.1